MTRQFSIPTVLRMVPNALLREFFEKQGHSEFDPKWSELREREIEPILAYLDELERAPLDEIESALRSVFDLSCDSGLEAILEAARHSGNAELGRVIPEDLGVYGKAMWVFLNHRRIFDRAHTLHDVTHMSWWRKRNDLPSTELDLPPQALRRLEDAVSDILRGQGRGKECTVETFRQGETHYFFAYPDDFVENVVIHDEDGKLAPCTFRKTLLVAFAYNGRDGSLELCAKLAKQWKERLEAAFAQEILGWSLGPYEPEAAYELNHLKDDSFDLRTDPQDRIRVKIKKLRLSARHCGRRIHVEVDVDDPNDDIHKALRECLNPEYAPLAEWNVTQATFCVEFLPMDGRKPGRQTFDVTYPHSCNLRSARPERAELIQKYLKRWRIDRESGVATASVATGS